MTLLPTGSFCTTCHVNNPFDNMNPVEHAELFHAYPDPTYFCEKTTGTTREIFKIHIIDYDYQEYVITRSSIAEQQNIQ